jgi:hypothetical protein
MQGDIVDINSDIVDIKAEQITQNENIQNNTDNIITITENITTINEAIGTINENIGDLQEGQIEQNTNIQNNTDDITEINQDINEINTSINDINQNIDDLEQDLTNYSLITETGSQINLNINSSNFQMTAILKDKNGNVIHTSNVIDLPLETMVVGASYDNETKEVVLTLQNGTTLRFSVADLVSGLVSTDQLTQILSNYYNKNEVDALIPDLTDYVKNTDYATSSKGGVVKTNQGSFATEMYNGQLKGVTKNYTQAYPYMSTDGFITKGTLENVITGKELINQTQLEESQALQNTEIEALQNKVEELETENENLRKALPQIKGEGTDFTLNNTSENKFVDLGLEGNTEQDAEPTPETLVPIKNVTGNANVKICNANLNDEEYENGFINDDGNIGTETNRIHSKNFINVAPNTDYTFSIIGTLSGMYYYMAFYDTNKNIINKTSVNSQSTKTFTFTTPVNAKYIRIGFSYASLTSIETIQTMLNVGSTATSYVEHQEQNLPFSLKSKNLYNDNAPITEYYINNQGQFVRGTNGDTFIETIIENDIASNYVISYKKKVGEDYVRFSFFNENTIISRMLVTANNEIVNVPTNTTKIYIHTDKRDTKYFEDLQIEAGTTATEYEPFYDIKAMQGTEFLDDGIHQKRKKKILDGTENFGIQNGCFTFNLDDINADINNNKIVCISNYYKGVVTNYRGSINNFEIAKARGATTQVAIKDNRFTTTADFKANLAELYANGTPVIVEYELAESELENNIIPYNETQQAQYNTIKEAISYYEQTNISGSSDELSPIITASAVGDLNLILNN